MRFLNLITLLLFFSSLAWSAPDANESKETYSERFLQLQQQREFFRNCQEGKNPEAIKKYLSSSDMDINAVANDSGATALLLVIQGYDEYNSKPDNFWDSTDHMSTLKILLGQPAIDVNKSDSQGETALHKAADRGYLKSLKLLLAHADIDVNRANNEGRTALMMAMREGDQDSIKLLLARDDIDVNAVDKDHESAFTMAVISQDLSVLTLLLADPRLDRAKLMTTSDRQAFSYAVSFGGAVIVEYLLNNFDVDINRVDQYGQTALLEATSYDLFSASNPDPAEIVRLLLTHPDIDTGVKHEGLTALMQARENAYEDTVEVLTQAGVTE